jgi:hypothetical protein
MLLSFEAYVDHGNRSPFVAGVTIWCTLVLESEMVNSEMIWASTLTWTLP